MLPDDFRRSLAEALAQIASAADCSVDCVVVRTEIEGVVSEVVADMCLLLKELRRVLTPAATVLLVFQDSARRSGAIAALRWQIATALQGQGWTLRNVLVGPATVGSSVNAAGFFFVSRPRYHFDVDALRLKYGKNPGDVVVRGSDSIVDRFITAARPADGRLMELFELIPDGTRAA